MASVAGRYGGVVKVSAEIRFADRDNAMGDLVEGFEKASVEVDVDQVVASKFTATINEYREMTAYKTFFAPFLTVEYLTTDDPLGTGGYMTPVTLREQMGLYTLLPLNRDFDGGAVTQAVTAYDMMWLLSQRFLPSNVTLAKGTNAVNYIRGRLDTMGFRHSIRTSTQTLTTEMTWNNGTSWVSVLNDLLDAIGFYHLAASRTGRLESGPYKHISQVEEQTTFSTEYGDIGRKVTLEPDPEYIRNDVIVYGNTPENTETPISARATNVDRNSPTSIYALRSDDADEPVYLTLIEDDSSIESTSVAAARANKLLEERTSMFYRMEIETVPYPGLDMREPIRLEIQNDAGIWIANEKWWWDHLTVGFTPDAAAMKLRCNRLLPFEVAES